MADPRFFAVAGPFTLAELAARTGAEIAGAAGDDLVLRDVAPLEAATPDCVTFLDNKKYVEAFARSRAGAAFVHPDSAGLAPAGMALLLSPQPYKAYALAASTAWFSLRAGPLLRPKTSWPTSSAIVANPTSGCL